MFCISFLSFMFSHMKTDNWLIPKLFCCWILYVPVTQRREIRNNTTIAGNLEFAFDANSAGISYDYRDVIVFGKLSIMLSIPTKTQNELVFSNSSGLKSVFENFVWTVGLTVENTDALYPALYFALTLARIVKSDSFSFYRLVQRTGMFCP